MLDAEFADKKADPAVRFADYVVSGGGPDDTVDGMTKIKRFKKEPFPQILVSVNITRSAILYQQMRGRDTRKAANKPIFTLFDFVGVTGYHGDDEEYAQGCAASSRPARWASSAPRATSSAPSSR